MARRYARDNRGRFASVGATARGGRLKTAGGNKRQTQTMQASAAPRAGAIRGKVKRDPTAASRVGQTAAAPAAAKPKARRRRTISPEKTVRVTQRVNAVTAAAASKSGVKRMNATEVGVRAKAFLTRKAGGMSGMKGKNFAEQQAIVRSSIASRPRYSTQTPNRNKPLRFNALGQDRARQQAKIENRTAREKIAAATKKPPAPKPMSRVMGRRELIGRNFLAGNAPATIKAPRVGSTVKKPAPKAKASNLVVRTRKQSKARQRFRRESILFQTRSQSPGTIGLGAPRKNNPRIRKQQTGMSQLSLIGKAKPLVRFRPVRG